MPTIYRIVKYEGTEAWLEKCSSMWLNGSRNVIDGDITTAIIDPDDNISISIACNKFMINVAKLEEETPCPR